MDSLELLNTKLRRQVLKFVKLGLKSVLSDMVAAVDREDVDPMLLQDICDIEAVNTMKAFFSEQHYKYPRYQLRLLLSLRKHVEEQMNSLLQKHYAHRVALDGRSRQCAQKRVSSGADRSTL
ncbi:hypothetical protein FRC08_006405 [Ceratobasidium sp. 394]|nr:hypothetical protein FRC08_006405 [Ceratobasidium sp. 394]